MLEISCREEYLDLSGSGQGPMAGFLWTPSGSTKTGNSLQRLSPQEGLCSMEFRKRFRYCSLCVCIIFYYHSFQKHRINHYNHREWIICEIYLVLSYWYSFLGIWRITLPLDKRQTCLNIHHTVLICIPGCMFQASPGRRYEVIVVLSRFVLVFPVILRTYFHNRGWLKGSR